MALGKSCICLGLLALKKHVLSMCYVPFAGLRLLRRGRFLLASKRVRKAKRLHDQAANVNEPGLGIFSSPWRENSNKAHHWGQGRLHRGMKEETRKMGTPTSRNGMS